MKRLLFVLLVAAGFISTSKSSAAVFERDWKAPGDGLLTFDDVNQREWLDLSVSRLDQFPEPRLAKAINEIAPDGLFDGFTWATSDDVIGLAQSAGIDIATRDFGVNGPTTSRLIELLGITSESLAAIRSVGLIDEIRESPPAQLGADIFVIHDASAGVFVPTRNDSVGRISNGLMLYRFVPEPASAFFGMAALSMSISCFRSKRRA